MTHEEHESQGTGLRDVFDILYKETQERLISLTIQLGDSLEDNIIHALCLIILQKEALALNKLQMLKDNYLANQLAERWRMSGNRLADFGVRCGDLHELTGESLAGLARIFRVLSEQRLCDPLQRNLAYRRALSTCNQTPRICEELEYDRLREEAKVVCGPVFKEWMCSSGDLTSGSSHYPHRSLDEVNPTLKCTDRSESAFSLASPLQARSLMPSYPTHLEISIPPTLSFQGDKINPETVDKSKHDHPQSSEEPPTKSMEQAKNDSKTDVASAAECCHSIQNQTPNQSVKPKREPSLPTPTNAFAPKLPDPNEMHVSKGAEEEEEATFYAFVILHAPQDADVAESMREKLERITSGEGATFSEDFAIPGKSTLRCVEDAINNSAFTLLLLTRNFNTRMVDMETETALVNSIHKQYKHNTVIPLLPQENGMPKMSMPMVLQTIVPLEEKRNFEKKVQKLLSPANLKRQQRIWEEEQRIKRQKERQEQLKQFNQLQKQLIQECGIAKSLEMENLSLLMKHKLGFGASVPPEQAADESMAMWPQQRPNIHIENAQYIMIGNDSQMTVDHCGGADKDDFIFSE